MYIYDVVRMNILAEMMGQFYLRLTSWIFARLRRNCWGVSHYECWQTSSGVST